MGKLIYSTSDVFRLKPDELQAEYEKIQDRSSSLSTKLRKLVIERVEAPKEVSNIQVVAECIKVVKDKSPGTKLMCVVSDRVFIGLFNNAIKNYDGIRLEGAEDGNNNIFIEDVLIVPVVAAKKVIKIPENVIDTQFLVTEFIDIPNE